MTIHWFTKPAFKILLLAFLGLTLATPLFWPAMLCGDDFQFHLVNTIELDRLWSEGVLYPRWSPNVALGRGLPTFNFYPPLPRYLSTAMHRLGLPIRESVKATMVLAFMLAGPAMYVFARSIFGERAGVAAGIAFAFAPYLANDALQRLAINETIALVLMPLVLWTVGWLDTPSLDGRRIIACALGLVALLLTHLLMAAMFAPLLIGYGLLAGWNSQRRRTFILAVVLAGLLALGLAAFFWLPYLLEIGNIQMWRARVWELTGELLYPLHLRSWEDILRPTMLWPDYSVNNPIVQRMLALPQVIGALVALVLVRRWSRRFERAVIVLFGLMFIVSTFLIVRASKPVWDWVSPLQMIQFPWRFLGPASLAAALLTGVLWAKLTYQISNAKFPIALDVVFVLVMMAWTLPWLRPFLCDIESNPSGRFMVWVDHRTEGAGSTGEHSPKWVEQPPDESPLEADLLAGRLPDRLDRAAFPEGAQAQAQVLKSLDSTWQVKSPQAFTATFQTCYFPGWSVRVDGQPIPIAPVSAVGLIEVRLPAGEYTVNLRLDSTSAQTAGNILSIVTAFIALAVWARAHRSYRPVELVSNDMPAREAIALGALGVILFVARLWMSSIAPPAVPLGPYMPKTATRTSIDLGSQVRLIGYEFSSTSLRAGEPLTVTLYWETQGLLLTSYKSFVHAMDSSGKLVAQSDVVPRNWTYPTNGWLPNEWIGDPHKLDLPANITGPVGIWVGMYDPDTGQRLNPPGDPSGRIRLGIIQP